MRLRLYILYVIVEIMPRLASFHGIDVYMYYKDHAPPHVHAFYGDEEALLLISTGAVYTGSLPARQLARAQEYVLANTAELLMKWAEFGGG